MARRRSPHRPLHHARAQNPLLQSLSNMAGQSGGTPPQGQQPPPTGGAPWESDPVLQQIQSLQAANVAAADAQAQAARQQALINYGYSPALESLYGDQGTKGAAQANPTSILAQLLHGHTLREQGLNEAYNRANGYYSSSRGNALGEEARGYVGQQQEQANRLRAQLEGYSNADLAAHQQAQGAVQQGTEDAYTRWLNQQLQYGLGAVAPAAGAPRGHARPRSAHQGLLAQLRRHQRNHSVP